MSLVFAFSTSYLGETCGEYGWMDTNFLKHTNLRSDWVTFQSNDKDELVWLLFSLNPSTYTDRAAEMLLIVMQI
jgi:hypothetical protein